MRTLFLVTCLTILYGATDASAQFTFTHPVSAVQVPFWLTTFRYQLPSGVIGHNRGDFTDDLGSLESDAPANFPHSPGGVFGPSTLRIAANLNQRFRLVANPFMNRARVQFLRFAMDSTSVGGTLGDRFELDWATDPPPPTPNFLSTIAPGTASLTGPVAAGTNSLQFPGMIMRVRTGADAARFSGVDHESFGFAVDFIEATPRTTLGNSIPPTFSPYENVGGLLMGGADTVFALLADTTHFQTLAFWTSGPVSIFARCNADPTPTTFNSVATSTGPGGGALLELGLCSGGGQWHIAITSPAGSSPTSFHIVVGAHWNNANFDQVGLRVGLNWNASSAQLTSVRASFRTAAWRFFGATGGTRIMRSFRFVNNTPCASSGSACEGTFCHYCVQASSGRASCDIGASRAYLFDGENVDPETIMHESGHCRIGLGDEYTDSPPGNSRSLCNHSMMALTGVQSFCSHDHAVTTEDYTVSPMYAFRGYRA